MIDVITSRQNKLIKDTASLFVKKHRDKSGLFVAEGEKIVRELGYSRAEYALASKTFSETHQDFLDAFKQSYVCSDDCFDSISELKSPEGILAVATKFDHTLPSDSSDMNFCVICEEVNDPGNLGTIIRTAHAAGADAVLLTPNCADVYNPKTIRASAGSVFHIKLYETDLKDISGLNLYASYLYSEKSLFDCEFKKPFGILIGNEARGLSKEAVSLCTETLKIPMPGGAESLNASVSAGIIIYEALRRILH